MSKTMQTNRMTLETEGETHVIVTRRFAASPEAVYRAHTDPKLIQQWLLGPEGWVMPVCIYEGRPGGKIRYEWTKVDGSKDFLSRARFWRSDRAIGLFTWSGCTCRIQLLIIMLRRGSIKTAGER